MDAGLESLKHLDNLNLMFNLPKDKQVDRIYRIYEFTHKQLSTPAAEYIKDQSLFEKYLTTLQTQCNKTFYRFWINQFCIPETISKMNLEQLLATLGFLTKISSKDSHDSLRNTLRMYILKNKVYTPVPSHLVTQLLQQAYSVKHLLSDYIMKLSITYSEKGNTILYWDTIPCKR